MQDPAAKSSHPWLKRLGSVVLFVALAAVCVGAALAVAVWSDRPTPGPTRVPTPEDWQETESIDPAGDLAALQGRWLIPASAPPPWACDVHLVIEGDTATFTYDYAPPPAGSGPRTDKYTFALNSAVTPKVIRFTERLEAGKPGAGGHLPLGSAPPTFAQLPRPYESSPSNQASLGLWYELDKNALYTWDYFYAYVREEGVKHRYQRVKLLTKGLDALPR